MLKIYFGHLDNELPYPGDHFDLVYEESWFDDELVKAIVKDIDRATVYSAYCMTSEVWGAMNCTMLSTTAKNLILMYKVDGVHPATYCGDNGGKWIVEIAKRKDLTITLGYIMKFERDFSAVILNNNKTISTYKEYLWEAVHLL
jgi:hypothetical protein